MNITGDWTNNGGTFTTGTGTVTFNGTGNQNITSNGRSFYNFTVDKTSGSAVLQDALTVTNDLTIQSGTLNANGKTITVSGNWSNFGNYISGNNTVIFNDNTKTSTISGDTDFYNVTCSTSGKHITFTSGSTQTIEGSLTLHGAIASLIVLRASGLGQWNIDIEGTTDITFVDMKDSNNIGIVTTIETSRNSGNNTGWIFLPVS